MLRTLWDKFDRDWGWNLSRLLAYTCIQMLFAAVGFDLILCALFLHVLAPASEQGVVAQMLRLLPDHVTTSAVSAFERGLRHAPLWLLLAGLPVTLWYGTRFFVVLESVLAVVFRRRQRGFLRQNRVAFAMFPLVGLLLPVIVLAAAVQPHLDSVADTLVAPARVVAASAAAPQWNLLARLSGDPAIVFLGLAASLAANFLLLLLSYTLVTPGRVSPRAAWPGALAGAVLAQLYLLIFPVYARTVLHPDQFGTIAGFALVILVFFFAYSLFLVLGAEIASRRAGYAPAAHDVSRTLADARDASDVAMPGAVTRPLSPIPVRPIPWSRASARPRSRPRISHLPAPDLDAPWPRPSGEPTRA